MLGIDIRREVPEWTFSALVPVQGYLRIVVDSLVVHGAYAKPMRDLVVGDLVVADVHYLLWAQAEVVEDNLPKTGSLVGSVLV